MLEDAIRSLRSAEFCIELFLDTKRNPTMEQLGLIRLKVRNALAVFEAIEKNPTSMRMSEAQEHEDDLMRVTG